MVPLAWACRAAGHEVLVAVPENFVDTVLRSGLPAVSSGPPMDFVELGPDLSTHPIEQRRHVHGRVFGRIAAATLPRMLSIVDAWRPDVVLSERAEFAGPLAAAAHGTPLADVRWGVAELPEYRAGAVEVLAGSPVAAGLAIPEPALSLSPWPPSLRLPHATGQLSFRHVSYNGTADVPDWVLAPRTKPRICLTLGTLVPLFGIPDLHRKMLAVVRELGRLDVDVVIAVDERAMASWGPLPENVSQAGRMPLHQVLGACDVLIQHGGQGTTLTAFSAGVPQLALPQFDDQFENADAVAKAGAGIRMLPDEVTPRAVAAHCEELLGTPAFAAAASAVAREMAAQLSPLDVVADLEALGG
ncbi:nucleotide disphospho-sugar-binding domain-containing protein [Amycolatopsis sp. NPDC048633]|uniref:nucleotide disphospho-sugar-binding domain-containing protein n=1 Tax=Amycolatopsis sp. NPDC048633 TaxID=3157095 RepID=UPI0033F0175B